jgi:hypothetical protein
VLLHNLDLIESTHKEMLEDEMFHKNKDGINHWVIPFDGKFISSYESDIENRDFRKDDNILSQYKIHTHIKDTNF